MSILVDQAMYTADLPTGKPSEPENASQLEVSTTISSMSLQSQELFTQPPEEMSQLERLLWYQERRTNTTLLWVQCDFCDKWRYIAQVYERHQLPEKWFCNMHPDIIDCKTPEEQIPLHIEADMVHTEYSLGSLVLVRFGGWPWWPAMVDDDPDIEQFYWIDELCDIPSFYHVTFFDDKVSRAWIPANSIIPFKSQNTAKVLKNYKKREIRKRIERSLNKAEECAALDYPTRLKKFSFVNLYDGPINTPKNVTQEEVEKYNANLKRKYGI